jgi:D-3-phosphoglycerate dehydrogenase
MTARRTVYLDCPVDFLPPGGVKQYLGEFAITDDRKAADCVIVNPGCEAPLDAAYFAAFPNLKVAGTPSTGTNHMDLAYLRGRGIKSYCLLDDRDSLENIHASAEFTWMHIMNSFRKFHLAIEKVDDWRDDANEAHLRSNELHGKKLGIIGLGRIGRKVAGFARAFGMQVLFLDPNVAESPLGRKVASLSDFKECDAVSINPVLNDSTRGMIRKDVFQGFQDGLRLINTSRGEVVDEAYILELVRERGFRFSCDVLQHEQDPDRMRQSALYLESKTNERVVVTPHVAGATVESQTTALRAILKLCHQ